MTLHCSAHLLPVPPGAELPAGQRSMTGSVHRLKLPPKRDNTVVVILQGHSQQFLTTAHYTPHHTTPRPQTHRGDHHLTLVGEPETVQGLKPVSECRSCDPPVHHCDPAPTPLTDARSVLAPHAPQVPPSAGGPCQRAPLVPLPGDLLCVPDQPTLELAPLNFLACCHGYHCSCRQDTFQMKLPQRYIESR